MIFHLFMHGRAHLLSELTIFPPSSSILLIKEAHPFPRSAASWINWASLPFVWIPNPWILHFVTLFLIKFIECAESPSPPSVIKNNDLGYLSSTGSEKINENHVTCAIVPDWKRKTLIPIIQVIPSQYNPVRFSIPIY